MKAKAMTLVIIMLTFLTMFSTMYAKPTSTNTNLSINNLQEAYSAEINGSAAYSAYASKADDEGFKKTASLFRALAKAEAIHAQNHKNILIGLGLEPNVQKVEPVVKSTKENLQAALGDEIYDNMTRYPAYKKQAGVDKIKRTSHDFEITGESEGVHTKLLKNMIAEPQTWNSTVETYYVCPTCGNVTKDRPIVCPICFEEGKNFLPVN
jgi:rubrerythrin